MRALFEKAYLNPAYQNTASDNITLSQILAEEKKFGRETDEKIAKEKKFSLAGLIVGLLIALAGLILYIIGLFKYLREWWRAFFIW